MVVCLLMPMCNTNAQANRDAHGHTNTHADAENLLLVLMQTV
jgi:hypothetical protein